MPKGSNPSSHRNKPTIPGLKSSEVSLFQEQWTFLEIIGQRNKSRGCREVVRAMQIIANRNWNEAADILGCGLTAGEIASRLVQLFPTIAKGRKNQHDLVQELALGECSLEWIEDSVIRVVNLASVEVIDGDRRLVEAYQQLANGEIFPRNIQGVAEKIQHPETPEQAARRGLKEELGIVPATLEFVDQSFDENQNSKYQGIKSFARKYQFRATLQDADIRDEYVENDGNKKTVFQWQWSNNMITLSKKQVAAASSSAVILIENNKAFVVDRQSDGGIIHPAATEDSMLYPVSMAREPGDRLEAGDWVVVPYLKNSVNGPSLQGCDGCYQKIEWID